MLKIIYIYIFSFSSSSGSSTSSSIEIQAFKEIIDLCVYLYSVTLAVRGSSLFYTTGLFCTVMVWMVSDFPFAASLLYRLHQINEAGVMRLVSRCNVAPLIPEQPTHIKKKKKTLSLVAVDSLSALLLTQLSAQWLRAGGKKYIQNDLKSGFLQSDRSK